uniref:Uncharacterized protein n=1 Tax=Caenorhabditis japonica TaxID=281687 RepID=A0A8R1IR99_CAEJA
MTPFARQTERERDKPHYPTNKFFAPLPLKNRTSTAPTLLVSSAVRASLSMGPEGAEPHRYSTVADWWAERVILVTRMRKAACLDCVTSLMAGARSFAVGGTSLTWTWLVGGASSKNTKLLVHYCGWLQHELSSS